MFAQALGADTKWKRLEHGAISGHSAILLIFQGCNFWGSLKGQIMISLVIFMEDHIPIRPDGSLL